MDKNTLKSSFGKWISPINTKKLLKQVEESKQDYYTKKLTTEAYIKLKLYVSSHSRLHYYTNILGTPVLYAFSATALSLAYQVDSLRSIKQEPNESTRKMWF